MVHQSVDGGLVVADTRPSPRAAAQESNLGWAIATGVHSYSKPVVEKNKQLWCLSLGTRALPHHHAQSPEGDGPPAGCVLFMHEPRPNHRHRSFFFLSWKGAASQLRVDVLYGVKAGVAIN